MAAAEIEKLVVKHNHLIWPLYLCRGRVIPLTTRILYEQPDTSAARSVHKACHERKTEITEKTKALAAITKLFH
jgi:hypothetical protein